ncbi:MAG: YceI family protein [Chitinophagaceae bacterium]
MKYILITLLIISSSMLSHSQYHVAKNTSVGFTLKNLGVKVNGNFSKIDAKIQFNPNDLEHSNFIGIIQASSINTGINLRDKHLTEKKEFFDVANFPTITMKSVNIEKKDANTYEVTWNLTIKGITKRFKTTLTSKVQNKELLLSTNFKINRNDWNVGGKSMTMNDIVTITISTTATAN